VQASDVRRVRLGTFVRPGEETSDGNPRVEVVNGYVLHHPGGIVLVDTGIGAADAETEAWYRPKRVPLAEALATAAAGIDEVRLVVNCHLHFDHCGGNPALAGRPVVTQRTELQAARATGYTAPALVDFAGARYEELDGEAEVMAGLIVVPTPGHTAGHQSVVVRCDDGTVVVAGQSHDHADGFTGDVLALQARTEGRDGLLPVAPDWIERLLRFDPRRVVFAHDDAVWEPAP
jgi:N-acyl homoserine lactone hydrolase